MSIEPSSRPKHLIPLSLPEKISHQEPSPIENEAGENIITAFYKLEKYILTSRQSENALLQERRISKKLQEDLNEAHSVYEKLLKNSETKNRELVLELNRLKAALFEQNSQDGKRKEQIQFLSERLASTRSELFRYKSAWASVLEREREAKLILNETREDKEKTELLQKQCQALSDLLNQERTRNDCLKNDLDKQTTEKNGESERIFRDKLTAELKKEQERLKAESKRLLKAEIESERLLEKARSLNLTLY